MRSYNLGFISDSDIFEHVKATVMQYRRSINLAEFNRNIIDPIKLTFDAKIYGQTMQQTIESECIRQIDKTNNNRIGYFHQHLFKYAGNGWIVPENGENGGFDVINDNLHIYVDFKSKDFHEKYNYIKFQNQAINNRNAICYLVVFDNNSNLNEPLICRIKKNGHFINLSDERIRHISITRLYDIIFQQSNAYERILSKLPFILNDVIADYN